METEVNIVYMVTNNNNSPGNI